MTSISRFSSPRWLPLGRTDQCAATLKKLWPVWPAGREWPTQRQRLRRLLRLLNHYGGHEVWIDAVFSPTWAEDDNDHVMFGCRVGKVNGQDDPAASVVAAAAAFAESRVFGHKLSYEEALAHPMLPEFWALVDHVLTHDEGVSTHLYGITPRGEVE